MTDYAISTKSKRSLWIPIVVFITLAACASAGYSYWHSHQVAADDKAQQRVVPTPVFYALDTFTVNLGDADRVLYIGITLRLKDEATRSRLSEYLPEPFAVTVFASGCCRTGDRRRQEKPDCRD